MGGDSLVSGNLGTSGGGQRARDRVASAISLLQTDESNEVWSSCRHYDYSFNLKRT